MQEAGVSADESGKEIVGENNMVTRVAVQGYLGWRKLDEWREVMKVLFG